MDNDLRRNLLGVLVSALHWSWSDQCELKTGPKDEAEAEQIRRAVNHVKREILDPADKAARAALNAADDAERLRGLLRRARVAFDALFPFDAPGELLADIDAELGEKP